MVWNYERTIAYICPGCSGITETSINIFHFSGNNPVKLICDDAHCGEFCASVRLSKDKYVIDTVCPVCGENHSFSVSKSTFWNKKLITFACPQTVDVEIIFMGEEKAVHDAVDETEPNDEMVDDMILAKFIDHINNMLCNGHIHCKCGNHRIIPALTDKELILSCDECDTQLSISMTAENILNLLKSSDLCIK